LQERNQNYLKGATILVAASFLAKFVSVIYKIPVFRIIDEAGAGTFQSTYNIFTLVLTISTAGVPVALSRMVSSANASGNTRLGKRYFSVALPAFFLIGLAAMLLMFFFAENLAFLMNNPFAAPGIRVLAPAVLFACIISVYRGYAQGHENMVPTALSQVIEVIFKAVIGIAAALWLVHRGFESQIVSAGAITGVTIGLGLAVPVLVLYKKKVDRNVVISDGGTPDTSGPLSIFGKIMKVSVPITLSSTFMAFMTVIDSSILMGRLQSALGFSSREANALYGVHALGLTISNLLPSIVVPVSISIVPAIAAAIARGRAGEAGAIMQSSLKIVSLIAIPISTGIMVLAAPMLMAIFQHDTPLGTTILTILGAATFFICLQYITTAFLQANGHERVSLLTFPIGAVVRIAFVYLLSGISTIGVVASSIAMLACFIVISVLNISFIMAKIKDRPKFSRVFFRPLLCAVIMAMASLGTYELLRYFGGPVLGIGQLATTLYLIAAVLIGISAYVILIVVTKTVTMDDMLLLPKGAKLAKFLRVRE